MKKKKLHHAPDAPMLFDLPETNVAQALDWPTNYTDILARIDAINPVKYAYSRNFINGAVTYLSPYIARGVVSLAQVKTVVLQNYSWQESEKLLQELAWREYFQRVWQSVGEGIFTDLKQPQGNVMHHQMPDAFVNASTQIEAIDTAIQHLYDTGYMHNHCRMYTAMIACNVAKSHWLLPAKWMYYHLLDGDWASNALSWQWVAGSFSSKKYFANQENINKYTFSKQRGSYLDQDYAVLPQMAVPKELSATVNLSLHTTLPAAKPITLDPNQPLLVYNSYQLDPQWHQEWPMGNRVLLLEPDHFEKYPVSSKVIEFIVQLAKDTIPQIQVYVGSFEALVKNYDSPMKCYYKEHPTALHYSGNEEMRSWLFPEVTGRYPSFFAYWNACMRSQKKK